MRAPGLGGIHYSFWIHDCHFYVMQHKISSDSEYSEFVEVIPISVSFESINTFVLPMGKYDHQNKCVAFDDPDINLERKRSSCHSDSYLNNCENCRYGTQFCDHSLFAASSQGVVNPATNTENHDNRRGVETDAESTSKTTEQDDGCLHKEKSESDNNPGIKDITEFGNNTVVSKNDDSGISLSYNYS